MKFVANKPDFRYKAIIFQKRLLLLRKIPQKYPYSLSNTLHFFFFQNAAKAGDCVRIYFYSQ